MRGVRGPSGAVTRRFPRSPATWGSGEGPQPRRVHGRIRACRPIGIGPKPGDTRAPGRSSTLRSPEPSPTNGIRPSQETRTTREFSAIVTRERSLFVAQCLDVDVAGQGVSEDEALSSPREAIELYFESPRATAAPRVSKVRAEIDATSRSRTASSGASCLAPGSRRSAEAAT